MGKKSGPPDPPDLQPITDAQLKIAEDSNKLAQEYLGLSREQYDWMKANAEEELDLAKRESDRLWAHQDRVYASDEETRALSRQVSQSQLDAMDLQQDYAERDRARYDEKFVPMQDEYIEQNWSYDTPERREAEASRAMVDSQRQAEAQRTNSDQRLRSMGLDPSQLRSTSLVNQMSVTGGAQQALAGNNARTGVEERGRAMRADAINVGAGLPAQSSAGFAGSSGAGAGAIGAGQAGQQATLAAVQGGAGVSGSALGFRSNALNNVSAWTGSPTQWAGMGNQMMGQSANTYSSAANTATTNFNNQMSSWDAGQKQSQQAFNNVASVGSLAAGMMMAEGGVVYAAEGLEPGMTIERERFDAPEQDLAAGTRMSGARPRRDSSEVKLSRRDEWRKRKDTYLRKGEGSGKGGALSFGDRASNGLSAAGRFSDTATNLFDEPSASRSGGSNMVPYFNYAEGGRAPRAIPVRQSRDKYPAMLTEGEYVLPSDVVRAIGLEKLDKMVAKYHREGS